MKTVLLLILCFSHLTGWAKTPSQDLINWELVQDKTLEECLTSGKRDLSKLSYVEAVDCRGFDITSLKGIEQFHSIKSIYLDSRKLSDIKPILQLKNLEYLWLENIETELDINSVAKLKILKLLRSEVNVSAPEKHDDLIRFTATFSTLEDMSFLANLPNLKVLYVPENPSVNLETISKLTKLEKLDLSDSKIKNLEKLSLLKRLKRVNLSNNEIKDISSLEELPELESVFANNNRLEKLPNLKNFKKLKYINLEDNKISGLVTVALNKYTSWLSLKNNEIVELNIESIDSLSYLSLSNNKLTKIDSSKITKSKLKELYVSNNNLTEVTFISKFKDLEEVVLYKNNIKNIDSISQLAKLRGLDISYNPISTIKSIVGLEEISSLGMKGTKVQNLNHLTSFKKLINIFLKPNEHIDCSTIPDIYALRRNSQLPRHCRQDKLIFE